MSPSLTGVHHLKFAVTNLEASADWFTRALGADRIGRFDHRDDSGRLFAVLLRLPGIDWPVELRLAPDSARAQAGFDPVTFGVADERALDAWLEHLDREHIEHTPKVTGLIGQLIALTTPDGLKIRLYTDPAGGFGQVQLHPDQVDPASSQL